MTSDDMLLNVVAAYDRICPQYSSDEHCEAILYICIENNSATKTINEFAVMTVNDDFFIFYVLNSGVMPNFQLNDIRYKKIIHYSSITKIKSLKFLVWENIKIWVNENGYKYILKLVISYRTIWIGRQRDNLLWLMDFIKQKGLKQ